MRRRGFYLIDMLVTMTLMVGLLSMCVVWTGKSLKYSSEVRQRASHQKAISQANSIRQWVRYSTDIQIDGSRLLIQKPTGKIEIEIADHQLRIVDSTGEKQKHESIDFADNAVLTWNEGETPRQIELQIDRKFETGLRTDVRLKMSSLLDELVETTEASND